MIQFFKDSVRELKHVVWPTRGETKNYFFIVTSVLIAFGLYLFIASTVFYEGLHGLKSVLTGNSSGTNQVQLDNMTEPTVSVDGVDVDTSTVTPEDVSEASTDVETPVISEEVVAPEAEIEDIPSETEAVQ